MRYWPASYFMSLEMTHYIKNMASFSHDSLYSIVTSSSRCDLSCSNIVQWSLTSHTAQTLIWLAKNFHDYDETRTAKHQQIPQNLFPRLLSSAKWNVYLLNKYASPRCASKPSFSIVFYLYLFLYLTYSYLLKIQDLDQISDRSEKPLIAIGHLKTIENGTILLTLAKVSAECRDKPWAVLWGGLKKQIQL